MANIKISELNELETKHDNDLLAIVDIANNETKKIKVETLAPENFELYAIADTQPTIPVGESYYNTTSNKIFTNVDGVYVDKGEPKTGILYIIFSDKATFAYDGETMVSVGGGSGETITQGPTAPENPEENDLWIDTANGNTLKRYNGTSWELVSTSSDAPIGTIVPFAGTTAPNDYLLCDGTAVSRTTYSDLFAVIGTTYGSGDDSTTFNLPNIKGRVLVGLDGTQTEFDTLGETGGSKDLQAHSHSYLAYGYIGPNEWGTKNNAETGDKCNYYSKTTDTAGTGDSGNLQPYIVVNYIIKATKTTPIQAEIVNEHSTSTEDAYSCAYVNDLVEEVYSTNEVKTNKVWIDGKPVYRKVLTGTTPSTSGSTQLDDLSNLNIDKMISLNGVVQGDYDVLSINMSNNTNYIMTSYQTANKHIYMDVNYSYFLSKLYRIIIEYTKTTD